MPATTFMDIVQYIKDNISNGIYPINGKIPPERILAEELQVSRTTLREALRALESIGIIERKVGQGTFVKKTNFNEYSSFSKQSSPSEVFTARLAIEPFLAELATRNATHEDLLFIDDCIQKMKMNFENIPEFEKLNTNFHYRIATAARSSLLLNFVDIIETIHTDELWGTLRAYSLQPDKMEIYHRQHISIYKALKNRDSQSAREATIIHLKTVRGYMLDI